MATIVTQEASPAWSGGRLIRLKQRAQAMLEQLGQVPGVQGACLCDNHGGVLGMLLALAGDRRLFERLGLAITQSLAALPGKAALKTLEIRFERKQVVARDLGNAALVLLCSMDANPSVVRMAVDVAANPFETDAELQRDLGQAAPSRSHVLSQGSWDSSTRLLAQRAGLKVT